MKKLSDTLKALVFGSSQSTPKVEEDFQAEADVPGRQIIIPASDSSEADSILLNSVLVLVGANGAGKSRMGSWIEKQNGARNVHRITAQKLLKIKECIPLLSLQEAEDLLFQGDKDVSNSNYGMAPDDLKLWLRWRTGGSFFLDDMDAVLATLFATKRVRDEDAVELLANNKAELAASLRAPSDELIRIWTLLLPLVEVKLKKDRVIAKRNVEYSAKGMSDGERVILYLIAQVLLAKPGMILIIDEPEIHIHKSILAKLWNELERSRHDCIFVYMTQDLEFAASRLGGTVIWVEKFDGEKWVWREVPKGTGLPDDLVLEVLGSQRRVLFCEGDFGSFDYRLYRSLYPESYVIPLGDCDRVIHSCSTARQHPLLGQLGISGVIDRDYRSKEQIDALTQKGLHVLRVAEIESLYCVPEVVGRLVDHLGLPQAKKDEVNDKIREIYKEQIRIQIFESASYRVRERLSIFAAKGLESGDLTAQFNLFVGSVDSSVIFESEAKRFESVEHSNDVGILLENLNYKTLYKRVASVLGIQPGVYVSAVLKLVEEDETLRVLLRGYVE